MISARYPKKRARSRSVGIEVKILGQTAQKGIPQK
jgi:hypothetical protein